MVGVCLGQVRVVRERVEEELDVLLCVQDHADSPRLGVSDREFLQQTVHLVVVFEVVVEEIAVDLVVEVGGQVLVLDAVVGGDGEGAVHLLVRVQHVVAGQVLVTLGDGDTGAWLIRDDGDVDDGTDGVDIFESLEFFVREDESWLSGLRGEREERG